MAVTEFPLVLDGTADCIFCVEQPERYPLVDRFYRNQGYKVKTAANESIYVLYSVSENGQVADIIAAARLIPQSSGHFWLRNLLVAKDRRGQGLASALMQQLLPFMNPLGCYCFALPHLEQFYQRLGFSLQPAHCPGDIQQKYQQYRARGRDWLLMGYIAKNTCLTE
jgi:GNAT superfamily N-acetyltransferase